MSVLGGEEIKRRLSELFESGADESCVDFAAYNLRLNDEKMMIEGCWYDHNNRYRMEDHGGYIELPPRKVSVISTIETLRLPGDLAAKVGITFSIARRGLISLFGPQVDPGYYGPFYAVVYNVSDSPIQLSKGDLMLKTEFFTLQGRTATVSTAPSRLPEWIVDVPDIRSLTKKDFLWEPLKRLDVLESNRDAFVKRLDRLENSLHEIRGGYRNITYFAIFLITATLFSVMLGFLFTALSSIAAIMGSLGAQILVLGLLVVFVLTYAYAVTRIVREIRSTGER
jgi:deoxycytidine triphosphate deaminase